MSYRLLTLLTTVLATSGEFDATAFTNLVSWHDASDTSTLYQDTIASTPATSSSDPVGYMADKSGNGYHVIQATSGAQPLLELNAQNNRAVLRFDGTNDALRNTSYADLGDAFTIFAVARYDNVADDTMAIMETSNGTSTTGALLLHESTQSWFGARDSTGVQYAIDGDLRNNNYYLHVGIAKTTQWEYLLNNTSIQALSYFAPNPNTINQLDIGRLASLGYFLNGDFCELVIYDEQKSNPDIAAISAKLAKKWGITLS